MVSAFLVRSAITRDSFEHSISRDASVHSGIYVRDERHLMIVVFWIETLIIEANEDDVKIFLAINPIDQMQK